MRLPYTDSLGWHVVLVGGFVNTLWRPRSGQGLSPFCLALLVVQGMVEVGVRKLEAADGLLAGSVRQHCPVSTRWVSL